MPSRLTSTSPAASSSTPWAPPTPASCAAKTGSGAVAGPAAGTVSDSQPIRECGIVSLAGHTGYNQNCDPTQVATTSQPYAAQDTNGINTCKGDLEVSPGTYQVWGYAHLDLNASAQASGNNAEAQAYLSFLTTDAGAQAELPAHGFLQLCQMQVLRVVEAGPYSLNPQYAC